jgi:hypothetical protein
MLLMPNFISSILRCFGFKKTEQNTSKPNNPYLGLREMVLTLDPSNLGVTRESNNIWGVLMETTYPEATVTLVTLADGTVSLYFSNGGGIIGLGQHEGPRKACVEFLSIAHNYLNQATPVNSFPLPAVGQTIFYFLTFDGAFMAEAKKVDLGNNRLPLSLFFHKAHEVITQIRIVDEKLKKTGYPGSFKAPDH